MDKNMDKIAVSVIVPIYNVEPYLSECLESLKRQTLKNIEIIMVNDGSTDNSAFIAQKFTQLNNNFKLINQDNSGPGAARNTGMAHAKGEYIYFIDGDDFIADNTLEILYEKASTCNLDILLFSAYTFIDGSNNYEWNQKDGYKYKGEYSCVYDGTTISNMFVENNDAALSSCCLMLSRFELIKQHCLRFKDHVIYAEDSLFHLQIIPLSKRCAVLNAPLYFRRYRKSSSTQSIDYMQKLHDMFYVSIAADDSIRKSSIYKNKTTYWYLRLFIFSFLDCWNKLSKLQRKKPEIIEYCNRLKPIARKFNYFDSKRLYTFMKIRPLYQIFIKTQIKL